MSKVKVLGFLVAVLCIICLIPQQTQAALNWSNAAWGTISATNILSDAEGENSTFAVDLNTYSGTFPSSGEFLVQVYSSSCTSFLSCASREIVRVKAVSGSGPYTLTIKSRNQESTTHSGNWVAGSKVTHAITGGAFNEFGYGFTLTDDSTWVGSSAGKPAEAALPTTGTNGCAGTTDKLLYNTSTNTFSCGVDQDTGGGGTGYSTIEYGGTPLTQRSTLNFVGAAMTCADNSGDAQTDCTIDSDINTIAGLSCTSGQIMNRGTSAWQCAANPYDAASITTGTLSDARLSSTVTNQGDTFNGASQLVQLTAAGKYPALDGSLITNLPSGFTNPMTTRGDIIYRNSSNVTDRFPLCAASEYIGSNGTDLTCMAAGAASTISGVSDTTDSSSYVALFESATGTLAPKTDAGITYNASTGVMTSTGLIATNTKMFNVMNYGAVGDGSNDDTSAISSALTAISTTGGILYFPAGKTFKTTSEITIANNNIQVLGNGATIYNKRGSGTTHGVFGITGSNITIDGLTFDSDGYSTLTRCSTGGLTGSEHYIAIGSTSNITIKNNKFINSGCWNIPIENSSYVKIHNNIFQNALADGVNMWDGSNHIEVSDNIFDGMKDDSVSMVWASTDTHGQVANIIVSNNIIKNTTTGAGVICYNCSKTTITGNHIFDMPNRGIGVVSHNRTITDGVLTNFATEIMIDGNYIYNVGTDGIEADVSNGVVVKNNTIDTAVSSGILASRYNNLEISNNTIKNVTAGRGIMTYEGGALNSAHTVNLKVFNNTIDTVYNEGIKIVGTSTTAYNGLVVKGNTLRNVDTAAGTTNAVYVARATTQTAKIMDNVIADGTDTFSCATDCFLNNNSYGTLLAPITASDQNTGLSIKNMSSTTARYPGISIYNYNGTGLYGFPAIGMVQANGTSISPTTLISDNSIFNFQGKGFDSSGYYTGFIMGSAAADTWTSTSHPAYFAISLGKATDGGAAAPERFRISETGNVGIGTTTPASLLEVQGASGSAAAITMDADAGEDSGDTWTMTANDGGTFTVANEATTVMTLNPTTSSITSDLDMSDDNYVGLGSAAGRIEFDDQSTDEINILNANVGIGTSAPGYQLEITNDATNANIAIRAAGTSYAPYITALRSAGTLTDPVRTASGKGLFALNALGCYDSDDVAPCTWATSATGQFGFWSSEVFTSTAQGTEFRVYTTPTGLAARAQNFTVEDDGDVRIGADYANKDYSLTFKGESSDGTITWMEDEKQFKFDNVISYEASDGVSATPSNTGQAPTRTTKLWLYTKLLANTDGTCTPGNDCLVLPDPTTYEICTIYTSTGTWGKFKITADGVPSEIDESGTDFDIGDTACTGTTGKTCVSDGGTNATVLCSIGGGETYIIECIYD